MVFYMLNKIADCAENVVRNFSHREHFPEAMLRICPGCQTCRTHESVARAKRVKRRPRDEATQRHQAITFPGGDAAHLSGLLNLQNARICSPGKARQAPPPGRSHAKASGPAHFPEAMLRICLGYWPVPIVATVNAARR
ncbi:hypothetical protein FMJ67_10375 [Klebsiella michiganensis]|nr:hypothetical protein [Klebsiella michiganensis]